MNNFIIQAAAGTLKFIAGGVLVISGMTAAGAFIALPLMGFAWLSITLEESKNPPPSAPSVAYQSCSKENLETGPMDKEE